MIVALHRVLSELSARIIVLFMVNEFCSLESLACHCQCCVVVAFLLQLKLEVSSGYNLI